MSHCFLSLALCLGTACAVAQSNPAAPLFLSDDLGVSWDPLATGLPEDLNVRAVVDHEGTLYLSATGDGVYVLPKGEKAWQCRNAGLPQRHDYPLLPTSLVHTGRHLVLGTYADGVFVSGDGGLTWRAAETNIRDVVSALHQTDRALYAGTHTGIWRSLDDGVTWEEHARTGGRVNGIATVGDRIVIASQNGFGVLLDGGVEWSGDETPSAIIQLLTEGNAVFAVTAAGQVYLSTDGTRWTTNPVPVLLSNRQQLPLALWSGYRSTVTRAGNWGLIYPTSRGWVTSPADGC